jgi:hypothetical protein
LNTTNNSADHNQDNNRNVTKNSKQPLPNETQASQGKFLIKIDEIIERDLECLATDKRLRKKNKADISLLKKQWKDFCMTYKKLQRERKKYGKNILSTNRQK